MSKSKSVLSRLPQVTIDSLPNSAAHSLGIAHCDRPTWGMGAGQIDLISGARVISLVIKSQNGNRFEFVYDDWVVDPDLVAGQTYASSPWGMRNEVIIAISPAENWSRKKFIAFDAYRRIDDPSVWAPMGNDGTDSELGPFDPARHEIIPGGWDHEHCCFCLTHIDDRHNPWGYVDSDESWLCSTCYEKYIRDRSFDFLEEYATHIA